jgi:EAL domain-containing protein (putative c-di-GMP-specific phosphodiesterase class I)
LRSAAIERHNLRDDLRQALAHGHLRVDYQPIVSLPDGHVVAAEALVRWQRQYGRLMTASEFVPMAEDGGLVVALGDVVFEDACRRGRGWLGAGAFEQHIAVHVNVSATELGDAGLMSRIADVLERSGLPGELLVLEVNERTVLRDTDRAAAQLEELRSLGVRVALDGFGSGYSSLSYLRTMPLSFLKIARPFIESITAGPREAAFVRTVRELATALDVQVVATAIESREQLELLTSLGCELGQGYLLGRPGMPEAIPLTARVVPAGVADAPLGTVHE